MKYASTYYVKLNTFGYSKTNMNQLCWNIEQWERHMMSQKHKEKFNYSILINETIPFDKEKYEKLKEMFIQYNKEMNNLLEDNYKFKKPNHTTFSTESIYKKYATPGE